MKKYFLIGILVLLCTTTSVFAQEDVTQSDEMQDIEGEVENLEIEIIADTNARNIFVANLDENVFGVGFDIVNEWDKTQPGVKHAIELYASDEYGEYLVDKIVYEDIDSLVPGQSIHKELTYSIPSSLPTDQYAMRVVLSSDKGLMLAIADAGNVEKSVQTGIYIDPVTCYLTVGDEKFALVQGVDVAQEEQLELVCESAKNFGEQNVDAFAYTTTKKRTSFGETVDEKEIAKETFLAGENKIFSYVIDKVDKPQAYESRFALRFNGQDVSNNIIFRYVVQGESATAQNATTDKDYYQKGDIAKVSLMTSGMASAYPGARDQNMDEHLIGVSNLVVKVTIVDKSQQACSDEQTKEIDGLGENVQMDVSITKDCQDPTVVAQIQDQEGSVLDEANFMVGTDVANTDSEGVSEGENNTIMMIAIVIAIIPLIVLAVYFIFRKKKYTNDTGMKTLLFLTILCGSFLLMNIDSVNAASFSTGKYHCFTLHGVKGYCVVNGTYDVPNGKDCTNTNASASMQWSACSNMTVDAQLFINGSRVWRDRNTDTRNNVRWISRNSGWKSKNLGKLSVGNHTIPFKMTFFHDWHDWDFNRKTEVITASKRISVTSCATKGACGPRHGKTGEWTTADLGRYAVCNSGTLEWISGLSQSTIGRWEWRCKGSYGGANSGTCWAKPPTVNGKCAQVKSPVPVADALPKNLCTRGTPTAVTGNGSSATPWKWDCIGSGPSHTDDKGCIAKMNPGRCTTTALSYSYPTSNWPNTGDSTFCNFGSPNPAQNSSTFPVINQSNNPLQNATTSWKCNTAGGDSDNCTATLTPPSAGSDITCSNRGETGNVPVGTPTDPLCSVTAGGSVSLIDGPTAKDQTNGTKKWEWTCQLDGFPSVTRTCTAPMPAATCGTQPPHSTDDTPPSGSYTLCGANCTATATPILESDGNWRWTCRHRQTAFPQEITCETPSCLAGAPIEFQKYVYFESNGHPKDASVTVKCPGVCCKIKGTRAPSEVIVCEGDTNGYIEVQPGSKSYPTECWFDKNNNKQNDNGEQKVKIDKSQTTVGTMCIARECNAGGTCQATPQTGNSPKQCKSSCNSNADCSSGRMIETRP